MYFMNFGSALVIHMAAKTCDIDLTGHPPT